MNKNHYDKYDPTFRDDVKTSWDHVDIVIKWLKSLNISFIKSIEAIDRKDSRIRSENEPICLYADDGDILLTFKDDTTEVLGCQWRNLNFTGKHDFPFPTIIVTPRHRWDRVKTKPTAYILTNRDNTYCAIVYGKTSKHWISNDRFDSGIQRYKKNYMCPVEHITFVKMI